MIMEQSIQRTSCELVEKFVRSVGKGVIQLLILDRGFNDGKNVTRCKQQWGIDVLIPIKTNMDIWKDAWLQDAQSRGRVFRSWPQEPRRLRTRSDRT
jgi:hypothetical protein